MKIFHFHVKKKRSKCGNIKKKIQKHILFELPILLIEIYRTDTFVHKSNIIELFFTFKNWKNVKHPPVNDWLNEETLNATN